VGGSFLRHLLSERLQKRFELIISPSHQFAGRQWEQKYVVDVNARHSNEGAMKPEDHARNSKISYSCKAPLPGELLVAMKNFVRVYDRYLALYKSGVICTTPQQKELMYIKLLRAYLSLLRRL
jgi:hypothetical protein